MIVGSSILLQFGAIKSLLLLLVRDMIPNADYKKWLVADGFKDSTVKDLTKTHLFIELKILKARFRKDILERAALVDDDGTPLSPIEIINLVQAHQNRIDKVRLMIEHKLFFVKNWHKPNKVHYVIARAYWIDNNGKRFRKFVKNMGVADKVYKNGEILPSKFDEVTFEIDKMMWQQYKEEYPD